MSHCRALTQLASGGLVRTYRPPYAHHVHAATRCVQRCGVNIAYPITECSWTVFSLGASGFPFSTSAVLYHGFPSASLCE